jgi:stage II sporulation protein E
VPRDKLTKYLQISGKYVAFATIVCVLTFARIDGFITPFAMAFTFGAIYLPLNKFVVAAISFLCSLFISIGVTSLISTAFALTTFLLAYVFIIKFKKRLNKHPKFKLEWVALIFFYIVANIPAIWFASSVREELFKSLISVLIGSLFLICVVNVIYATKTRRAKIPWTIDQKICLGIFVAILSLGLAGLDTHYFSAHKLISILIILIGVCLLNINSTFMVAVCLGLGQSLLSLNLNYTAIYTLLCCAAIAFKSKDRYYSVIALIATDIVLGFYFGAYIVYNFYSIIPLMLAAIIFLLIPKKFVLYFDFSVAYLNGNLVSKNTINKNRAGVYTKLRNLSSVFNEMQNIYKNLIQGSIAPAENSVMIASQVIDNVCDNCQNKVNCKKTRESGEEIKMGLEKLALVGLQRGNVNFMDLPSGLTMRCAKINSILSTTNTLLEECKKREANAGVMDAGKMLMSGLLLGVSRLCTKFADESVGAVVFDNDRADLIKEELLYKGIVASDCLITKMGINEFSVSLLISRSDATRTKDIENVVGGACAHKMQIDGTDDAETSGFCIVTLRSAPRYALVFGVATTTKNFNERNGDSFSFLKISHDRTIMAVCDGMGAGESAERASTLALSLVENFYKAGFPNEVIMTSVNQLLGITQQEIFSALDVAVFNQSSGEVDFIKVGAADGYIKREREVEVAVAGSLPLGILDEMQPKITHAVLSENDMVVLCSDGVGESFNDRVGLANYINNLNVDHPQKLADELLQECLNRTGRVAVDDCTIVVAKLVAR